MTRALLALSCFAMMAAGCAARSAPPVGDATSVALPVMATSMRTVYGIQLELRGSAAVRDRWVYMDIPAGAARTYQGRANAWDLVVRAGIATCRGRGSELIAEGRAAHLAPLVGLTLDDAELDTVTRRLSAPLHLEVGIPPGTDLQRSWMTIEVSWPIEGVIASYSLPATGGLADGAALPEARSEPPAAGDRANAAPHDLSGLGVRAPLSRVRCS